MISTFSDPHLGRYPGWAASSRHPRIMKNLASLFLAFVVAFGAPVALAQSAPESPEPAVQPRLEDDAVPAERAVPQKAEQALYKGVVGNLLEAVPMDADKRVELQRVNAVVSNPFSVRSLALLVGISNPVVMIGGLLWGFWAASQIETPKRVAKTEPPVVLPEVTAAIAAD